MAGRPGTRETPRKLAPPRGVPGPAVSASRGRSRRYERPFDRSCLTVRPRPSGKVSFRPVPARGPLPMAPCGADSAPFGGCPVGRSRPPFGLRADPFGPDVSVPVSLPGDKREGRACGGVRPPKTPMRFRERRRRFARRVEIRDMRPRDTETPDTRHRLAAGLIFAARAPRPPPPARAWLEHPPPLRGGGKDDHSAFGGLGEARNPEGVWLAPHPLGVLNRNSLHCLEIPPTLV